MLFRKLTIATALLVSFQSFAADVAEQLKAKLAHLQSFQARFSQSVVDNDGELIQQSEGKLWLKQPDKLLWELDPPNENILIADGNTLWHVDPFVEQAVAISQHQAVENNPIILLTNPDSEAWQGFNIRVSGNTYYIGAISTDSNIASLALTFNGETLVKLAMQDRQQQTSTLTFTQIEQNKKISDKAFQFTLPEGFDLDDQRNP